MRHYHWRPGSLFEIFVVLKVYDFVSCSCSVAYPRVSLMDADDCVCKAQRPTAWVGFLVRAASLSNDTIGNCCSPNKNCLCAPTDLFDNFCRPRLRVIYPECHLANSAIHPPGVGKWVVIHVIITWITVWRPSVVDWGIACLLAANSGPKSVARTMDAANFAAVLLSVRADQLRLYSATGRARRRKWRYY